MTAALDTNILLDVVGDDPDFSKSSMSLIEKYGDVGSLIISPIVYSELLVFFLRKHAKALAIQKLEEFLEDIGVELAGFDKEDLALAAEAWQGFSGIRAVACPKCGATNEFNCKKCDSVVSWRNHILTDFLIGAHAQNHAEVFLTRDRGYYRKYFKAKIMP